MSGDKLIAKGADRRLLLTGLGEQRVEEWLTCDNRLAVRVRESKEIRNDLRVR